MSSNLSKTTKGKLSFKSFEQLAAYIAADHVDIVDACFVDPIGTWHHCSFTTNVIDCDELKKGFPFDGSSIPLFTTVDKSDMVMVPDPAACWIDPFCKIRTLHVTCDVKFTDGSEFSRCPRSVAQRATNYLKACDIGSDAMFGPEPEFFLFDDVKFTVGMHHSSFSVDSEEGYWKTGATIEGGNLGHRAMLKSYYFPVQPVDTAMDIRSEMLLTLNNIGVEPEKHHHEVATAQHELGIKCSTLKATADDVMAYKYVVKNVARRNGKTATFMPKPLAGDNGSGMHCHQSIVKEGSNIFYDAKSNYCGLSKECLYYIGGLLKHASAVLAITNPTVNSYKRLVPGFEAPSSLVYAKGNRSAAIRIPLSAIGSPKATRFEFRCPDASCNPYLGFSAMLMAGIDGIRNKIEPPAPWDKDVYELSEAERQLVQLTPNSLGDALNALEADHEFLTHGGVFSEDYIKNYIAFKRQEIKKVDAVPSPKEFEMYYHC